MLLYGETPESFWPKHETIDEKTGEMRPMTLEDAQDVFAKYFAGKPKIKELIDQSKRDVEEHGYAELPSGFRRQLQGVHSKDFATKNKALRQSLNAKIQGLSAHIAQKALIMIDKFLKSSGLDAKLVLTVHDSVSLSTTKELLPTVVQAVEYIMTHLPLDYLYVPIDGELTYVNMDVESEVGSNYGQETELDPEQLKTFNSMEGYTLYHAELKRVKDEFQNKYISEEEYEAKKKQVESTIATYQAM